jgi:alkylation response protein AidB-like acyl-CoA dehydrogenase
MDFDWSEEQLAFKSAVVEFARQRLNGAMIERDREGAFSRELWQECARFGIQGMPFPEEYGGGSSDILTTMLTMEGLGYGCLDNGLIFGINAQMWSVQMPIFTFGTEEQKRKYLPGLCSGALIGAHGMSEPDAGSDAFSLRARAERRDGGYVLNGTKTFVTNAPMCDVALVFATVDPARKMMGVTGFLIDKGTPGFTVSKHIDKMGLRTSPMSEIVLDDCFVPESSRLGREGIGSRIFSDSMEWERSCILGSHLGAMERLLERCVEHARQRHQSGQPIGRFQSVANRIVEMKLRLDTARLLLYRVAWLKKVGRPAVMEAALAKLYLSECFVQSALDAIRTLGGYGYTTEYEVERELRDAVGGTLYSGTSDIQRNIVARLLGL